MYFMAEFVPDDPFGDPKVIGDPYCTIFVGHLSHSTSEETLRQAMSIYGRVKNLRLVRHIETLVLWLADEQEFWGHLEDDSTPLRPLGLQQSQHLLQWFRKYNSKIFDILQCRKIAGEVSVFLLKQRKRWKHGELAFEIAEEFACQYVSLPFDCQKVPHIVSVVEV
ncbi:unnamed protein product [Coffea canephora]|uniref:DH200=94 genomic scaffold, scaffold_1303 n=1 Tax=Coffea canephora TaxID=49390 RepID=A0A068VIT9_COFCA|nr:unnamed protein product [Coffea canephora]